MGEAAKAYRTGTLGKAVEVLDAVAASENPPRFTDLLNRLGHPRGTLHRQLSNLVEEDLLTVNRDHSYALGPRLLRLASSAWANNSLRDIAAPYLKRLHDETGETVHLAVLRGTDVIYLDKVESRQAVRMHSAVGNASPAYCTGVGKAMMSALPPAEAEQRVLTMTFKRFTDTTITDAGSLLKELANIRAAGVAYDREEHEEGIRCAAAPVCDDTGYPVAGLSVTAPAFRAPDDLLSSWARIVKTVADEIGADVTTMLGPRAL